MKSLIAALIALVSVAASCSKASDAGATARTEPPPTVPQPIIEKNRLPADAETLLKEASTMELLSLDPTRLPPDSPTPAQDVFHGYKITGRAAQLDAGKRNALAELVLRGIRESDGSQAKCFDPRHGIRVEQSGKVLELVICYECLSIEAYGSVFAGNNGPRTVLTSNAVEPAVTSAYNEVGLEIAGK